MTAQRLLFRGRHKQTLEYHRSDLGHQSNYFLEAYFHTFFVIIFLLQIVPMWLTAPSPYVKMSGLLESCEPWELSPKLRDNFYFVSGYYIVADFSALSGTDSAVMYGPQVQPDSRCFSFWFIFDTPETTILRVTLNDTNDIIFISEGM